MSGFGDLLKSIPNPIQLVKNTFTAPFENRGNAPWLQSTARNLGHAAFGDVIGNAVDQRLLGDVAGPNGQLYYNGRDVPSATAPTQPFTTPGQLPGPTQSNTAAPSPEDSAKLLMAWLNSQQRGL